MGKTHAWIIGDSLGAEIGLEIVKILYLKGVLCSCVMIDPGPAPEFSVNVRQQKENMLPKLFALTAADYLNHHSPT